MRSFLVSLSLFAILSIVIVFSYGEVCDYIFTSPDYVNKTAKREWIFLKKNQKFDYAILGSSRAEGALDIKLMDSLTNTTGINLGVGGAGFAENYLILDKFIRNNYVRRVFIQVDLYSFDSDNGFSNVFNTPNYLPYWSEPGIKEVVVDYNEPADNFLWTHFPFTRYIKFNKYYNPFELVRRLLKINVYQSDKLDRTSGTKAPEEKVFTDEVFRNNYRDTLRYFVNPKDLKYFLRIVELCKKGNIELVAFRAPEYHGIKDLQQNREHMTREIYTMLAQQQIRILDNNRPIEADYHNFVDATHLSNQGIRLFTYNFIQNL